MQNLRVLNWKHRARRCPVEVQKACPTAQLIEKNFPAPHDDLQAGI